jgi:hypothetical protein
MVDQLWFLRLAEMAALACLIGLLISAGLGLARLKAQHPSAWAEQRRHGVVDLVVGYFTRPSAREQDRLLRAYVFIARAFVVTLAASVVACLAFARQPRGHFPRTLAAQPESDDILRQKLLGAWVVPADSSDATPDNINGLEIFNADGTYDVVDFIGKKRCGTVLGSEKVWWILKGGILTSVAPGQRSTTDEIISIGPKQMILHSLDDDTTYTREHVPPCPAAAQ